MCIVQKMKKQQRETKICGNPSLQSIKKGTYVCEVAIVVNQIASKSENEPTTSDSLC